jgi:probable rRNA maturation factor
VTGKREFDGAAEEIVLLGSFFPPRRATVELNLVGERKMAFLNRNYKGRRGAAQVLTFSYGDTGLEGTVGEIYVCWNRLAEGARARKVSRRAYLLRLVVHGLCHIKGYGHSDDRSERKMERAEMRYLSKVLTGSEIERLFE